MPLRFLKSLDLPFHINFIVTIVGIYLGYLLCRTHVGKLISVPVFIFSVLAPLTGFLVGEDAPINDARIRSLAFKKGEVLAAGIVIGFLALALAGFDLAENMSINLQKKQAFAQAAALTASREANVKAKRDEREAEDKRKRDERYAAINLGWDKMMNEAQGMCKRGDFKSAKSVFVEMLLARPGALDAIEWLAKSEQGLPSQVAAQLKQKKDAEAAQLKRKKDAETAQREKQQHLASQLQGKKLKIKSLVDEFARGLPSPMGELKLARRGAMPITRVYHSHSLRWLNSQQTKAKIVVTTHGEFICDMSSYTGAISNCTADYQGGSFICEEGPEGNWRIVP